jgi:ATP-dependent DNA helicase PIF1
MLGSSLSLSSKQFENVFLTGFAGTGKTYSLARFLSEQFGNDLTTKRVAVTAPTWEAASVLEDELGMRVTSLHLWAGIYGHLLSEFDPQKIVEHVRRHPKLLSRWLETETLVIDEISMVSARFFKLLETAARWLRESDLYFGNIRLLLSGEFLQLMPVEGGSLLHDTTVWHAGRFVIQEQRTNRRFTSPRLIALVPRLGLGSLSTADFAYLKSLEKTMATFLAERKAQSRGCASLPPLPLFLRSRNTDVNEINQCFFDLLPASGEKKFSAQDEFYDSVIRKAGLTRRDVQRALDQLSPGGSVNITLRVGTSVMYVGKRIRYGGYELRRGMVGVVQRFAGMAAKEVLRGLPVVRMSGFEITIEPSDFSYRAEVAESETSTEQAILGRRRQLPLVLGYASTIHKVEGLTLDSVQVDLASLFCSGQGYVALTRCADEKKLFTEGVDICQNTGKIFADEVAVDFYNSYRTVET